MQRLAAHNMTEKTRDNRTLQRHLKVMLDEARRNEEKLHRLQALELLLLGAETLSDLIRMLLYQYRQDFNLDTVSLVLVDPQYEIRRILEEETARPEDHPELLFSDSLELMQKDISCEAFPQLSTYQPGQHAQLFPRNNNSLQSIAILPLVRQGRVIGSLNLGSADSRRYISGSGTELLERLAAIVSICIENTLNLERLKRTGLTDSLTTINNRRFFDQRINEEIERSRRNTQPLSCLFIDIDHFKKINDQYGHQTGDRMLQAVASLLDLQMRRSDVLARYGGEEFAVLLCNTPLDAAEEIAERVRQTVAEQTLEHNGHAAIQVTVSIGVATAHPAHSVLNIEQQAESLVAQADEALLEAKRSGRNRVCTASNSITPLESN